ncbi:MAG: IS66 family insertion sequence element accessory protein TnpA [Planctomycetota bacterium]
MDHLDARGHAVCRRPTRTDHQHSRAYTAVAVRRVRLDRGRHIGCQPRPRSGHHLDGGSDRTTRDTHRELGAFTTTQRHHFRPPRAAVFNRRQQFCARERVSVPTFWYWWRKCADGPFKPQTPPAAFSPVEVVGGRSISLRFPIGAVLEIPEDRPDLVRVAIEAAAGVSQPC